MDIANLNEEKKGQGFKILIIVLIIVLVIPMGILSFLYKNNLNFKYSINQTMSKMPGNIGTYFKSLPKREDRIEKIKYLGTYYLSIDPAVAADKLYLIKKEDIELYEDISREMKSISFTKEEELRKKIDNMEKRKDLLSSVHEEAKTDEEERFLSEITRIERQDIAITIMEIESKYDDREFLRTLEKVNTDILGQAFYYINPNIREYIFSILNNDKRIGIERIIASKTKEYENLLEITKTYETKPTDIVVNIIGNTETYSMEKLATIYKNLSIKKSAEILTKVDDEEFIEELFKFIIEEEELEDVEIIIDEETNTPSFYDSKTKDIGKAIAYLKEYNDKISNLVPVYEKMNPENIAKITSDMIKRTDSITSLELETENIFQLSDKDIIINVLSKIKNQTFSKVLDFMNPEDAARLTSLMAIPENKD